MRERWTRLRRYLDEGVWREDGAWARALQVVLLAGRGVVRDQVPLRAHSLTYITLLSLIPLLALAVSLVEAFGMRDRLTDFVVAQVGAVVPRAAEFIRERVGQVKFGSLGTVGGAVFLGTTLLAIGQVERSFNHIWGVPRQRGWLRRLPDYLFVVATAPVVLGVAISLGTTLRSQAAVDWLLRLPLFEALYASGLKQIPTLLFVAALTFVYWFLPNTRVKLLSAALGGLVAGLLFTLAQVGYVRLNAGVTRYDVVFGGFAAVPLFIVWVYLSWAIVLLGAEVAFAHQHLGRHRRELRGDLPGPAAREAVGLAVALEVAARFEEGGDPREADELADALQVRVRSVREILEDLEAAGIVTRRAGDDAEAAYQLGRPAERIRVADVLRALRGPRESLRGKGPVVGAVARTLEELDKRQQEVSERDTLADLLARCASTSTTTPRPPSAPR